jgi:hypothetical protein
LAVRSEEAKETPSYSSLTLNIMCLSRLKFLAEDTEIVRILGLWLMAIAEGGKVTYL